MKNKNSNRGIAGANIIVICIIIIITFLLMLSDFAIMSLAKAYFKGETISIEDVRAIEFRQRLLNLFYSLSSIISGILFIVWFAKSYKNLLPRIENPLFSVGWAIGVWFIPFMNLIRPYNMMHEMFSEAKSFIQTRKASIVNDLKFPLLIWWWVFYLGRNVLQLIHGYMEKSADTMVEIRNLSIYHIITCAVGIAAAVITIQMITQYLKLEDQLNEIPEDSAEDIPQVVAS